MYNVCMNYSQDPSAWAPYVKSYISHDCTTMLNAVVVQAKHFWMQYFFKQKKSSSLLHKEKVDQFKLH